jgi:hypothetical protein
MQVGYLYKTTFPDGRVYVGKKHRPEFDSSYFGSGLVVTRYIKKNGSDALSVSPVAFFDDVELLNLAEQELIDKSKRLYVKLCVNIHKGGDGGATRVGEEHPFFGKKRPEHAQKMTGRKLALESIEKIVAANRGRPRSEAAIRKQSAAISGEKNINWGKKCPEHSARMTGRKLPQSVKDKISKSKVGDKNPMFGVLGPGAKKVYSPELGMEFSSCAQAAKYVRVNASANIGSAANGERSFSGKHPMTGQKLTWRFV